MDHALPISYAFPAYPYSYSVNACEHLPLPVPLGFPTEQKLVEVIRKIVVYTVMVAMVRLWAS